MSQTSESSIRPDTGNAEYTLTPEIFQILVHEIGLSVENPIKNKKWNKNTNTIMYAQNPVTINVAPGKGLQTPLNITRPARGDYNYSYVLLKNTITLKAIAKWSGWADPDYSTSNGSANTLFANYSQYTETFKDFGNGNFEPYINVTGFDVEGLLLKNDKLTTATTASPSDAEYILAVFKNKISIGYRSNLDIKFTSTNRTTISATDWGTPGTIGFGSLPFVFNVTT